MFLIRATFWLVLAAFVLPQIASGLDGRSRIADQEASGSPLSSDQYASAPAPDTGALFSAALSSAEDIAGFCGRNPDTCKTASTSFAHMLDNTVHYGGIALDWAVNNLADQSARAEDGLSNKPFFNPSSSRAQNDHIGIPLQRPSNARG